MLGEGVGRSRPVWLYYLVFTVFLFAMPSTVPAQDSKEDSSSNPVGAGSNWQTNIEKSEPAPTAEPASPSQSIIQKINTYFNGIENLQGNFRQTNPDNTKTKGRFYVQRPGKIRFDYDKPSPIRIVADGHWLSIEDHDLKTFDRYPLESTPFKMLLRRNVDLKRDAKLVDYFSDNDLIIVTLEDRTGESPGRIKLFFDNQNIQLKEWIITDPQGLDTRVEISDLVAGRKKRPNFFNISDHSTTFYYDN